MTWVCLNTTAQSTNTANIDFISTLTESASVADVAPETGFDFSLTLAESVEMSGVLLPQLVYTLSLAESATGSTVYAPKIDLGASIFETAQIAEENAVAASLFSATIGENVTVFDPLTARFLWEEVDDSETTDWQEVNDSETTNWQIVVTTLP